jgi:UMF1 family MFS transporter
LLAFALLGATAATIFLVLPSSSPVWWLTAPLAVCANVGFGASVVAMNAYLPTLAKESPEVVEILDEIQNKHHSESTSATLGDQDEPEEHQEEPTSVLSSDSQHEPLLQQTSSEEFAALKARYDGALSRATSRISSLGIALGYGAGILLLLVALVPVTKLHGSTFSLRLAIGLSGIWWAIFSIPAALWLPGSSSSGSHGNAAWLDEAEVDTTEWSFTREIIGAWKRLGSMLRWTEIKKLRNTFKYLAAWFLLSDGMPTSAPSCYLLM